MSVMDFTNLINVDVDVFLKSDIITYQSMCHPVHGLTSPCVIKQRGIRIQSTEHTNKATTLGECRKIPGTRRVIQLPRPEVLQSLSSLNANKVKGWPFVCRRYFHRTKLFQS